MTAPTCRLFWLHFSACAAPFSQPNPKISAQRRLNFGLGMAGHRRRWAPTTMPPLRCRECGSSKLTVRSPGRGQRGARRPSIAHTVAVAPGAQGHGYCALLLTRAEDDAPGTWAVGGEVAHQSGDDRESD